MSKNRKSEFERLIRTALEDRSFASQLRSNPRQALEDRDFAATDEQISALEGLDWGAISDLADTFDEIRPQVT